MGNAKTKRFIRVFTPPDSFLPMQDSPHLKGDMAVVEIRVRELARGDRLKEYFFGIDPKDRMTMLAAQEYETFHNMHPIDPPSAAMLLKEIQTAQKIQPTLKQ